MAEPFFQLRPFAGTVWPALPDANLSLVWHAYRELDRSQWLTPAAIEEGQVAQLRHLLTHCKATVPYYRQSLRGCDPLQVHTLADFRRLPILERRTYQERAGEFLAQQLPPGVQLGAPLTTSGTSGISISVRQTNVTQLWWLACYLRDLEWSGLNPMGTMAAIRLTRLADPEQQRQVRLGVRLPSWQPVLDPLIASGPSFVCDFAEGPAYHLAWLQQIQPDYLLSKPTHLDLLAGLALDQGVRLPRLQAIQAFTETLLPWQRARIETAFGVPVKNLYSCSEAGYVASPCPAGHGLHVHAENVLVEVLDEAGRPCPPGQTGRVVLTPLHSYATPLIRYAILDDATPGPACPCGRGLPLLTAVEGKRRPAFHSPTGKVLSTSLLAPEMAKVPGMHQFQVIQRAVDQVLVRVVPGKAWSPDQEALIRAKVNQFFGAPVRTDVETLDRIPEPASGKLLSFVCEVAAGNKATDS